MTAAAPAPPACPSCGEALSPLLGTTPGLEGTPIYFQCLPEQLGWTPLQLEAELRGGISTADIRECFREDQRRGTPGGGGGGVKGRREEKPGMKRRNQRGGEWDGPLGQPDPDPDRQGKDRLTSSVHSVRLSADKRRKLQRIRETYGDTDQAVLERALDVLDAIESARPGCLDELDNTNEGDE